MRTCDNCKAPLKDRKTALGLALCEPCRLDARELLNRAHAERPLTPALRAAAGQGGVTKTGSARCAINAPQRRSPSSTSSATPGGKS